MKLSVLQSNFSRGLAIVGRAVSPRSTMPVLGNIKLEVVDGRLMLAATNLEMGITHFLNVMVKEDGAITVPARILTEFVGNLPDERIDMDLSVRTLMLNLKCARYNTNIKGIDASEFPLVPNEITGQAIQMPAHVLARMITEVAYAAATDEGRPALTGINVEIGKDGTITMAATDGFRLGVSHRKVEAEIIEKVSVIVPARAMAEVARIANLIKDDEAMVELGVAPARNQIVFVLPDTTIVSQLIDANFPNYQAIIPSDNNTTTRVDRDALRRALKVAQMFARDSSNIVVFEIEPGSDGSPGVITIRATSSESGDSVSMLDAVVEGGPVSIAFNGKYMGDSLDVLTDPLVSLGTTLPSRPGILRPVSGNGDVLSVVMPMHISK